MKVLLASDNKDLKELLSFQMSSAHSLTVRECSSVREAVDLLKKPESSFDVLVAPYNGPDSAIVQYLKERKEPLPVIFFFDPMIATPEKEACGGILLLGSVDQKNLAPGVNSLLKDFIQKGGTSEPASEFCPIRTNLLIRATPLKSDIYIRLSLDKFVRLFSTGDEFSPDDLRRYYESKGVEYMYLRRTETAEFIDKFRKDLDLLLARPDLGQEEAMQAVEMSQEAIHELVHRVGFHPEVQELAKKNVQLTLKAMGQNPRLSDLLGKVQHGGGYLSSHSTLLAHVSCCVAKEMEWGSDSTFTKLVLAAFLHDISLSDGELAQVNSLKELEEKKDKFPAEEVKAYHLHPARSADLVRNFKEIPADVDLIVQQHHERPNSGGFPRGLAHNYIAPLSALFIISHDLSQSILQKKDQFKLGLFVDEKKPLFNQGNFKKVMAALEKIKL